MAPRIVAMLNAGKTNAKVAIVDRIERTELDVRPRPNPAVDESPYPHYDVEAIWGLFAASMLELTSVHHIEGIAVSAHGASIVMLGHSGLAMPVLDYEYGGPD